MKIKMGEFIKLSGVMETIKKIVDQHQYQKVKFQDGSTLTVDATTANMLWKIYTTLQGSSRVKMNEMINKNKMNFAKLVDFGWKQVR